MVYLSITFLVDPQGPSTDDGGYNINRVIRSYGCCNDLHAAPQLNRSANRGYNGMGAENPDVGFRVVLDLN
jgi:hypothetical protein